MLFVFPEGLSDELGKGRVFNRMQSATSPLDGTKHTHCSFKVIQIIFYLGVRQKTTY